MAADRVRRPPSMISSSRGGSGLGDDRLHRADEESLREEQARLRKQLAALRAEGAEAKERLKAAERDSARKDKLLQELLATAKGGTGVPGEALDQLREDIQALLQVKRRATEARQQLDEKELKIQSIQQELKATSILDIEEDVAAAKMETKAKANEWAEANAGDRDTQVYAESLQHQKAAKALGQKIIEVENQITKTQQQLVSLQDERSRLEQASQDHSRQVEKLLEKRQEIERQKEQCEERVKNLGNVSEQHAKMKKECDDLLEELAKARQELAAEEKAFGSGGKDGSTSRQHSATGAGDWRIDERLLGPGFTPLKEQFSHASAEPFKLFNQLRLASQVGQISLIRTFQAQDSDKDGRITVKELVKAFEALSNTVSTLGTPVDISETSVQGFVDALRPGLGPERDQNQAEYTIAIADLALAVQLQPVPQESSGPSDEQLKAVSESLSWACRRSGMPERELRRRFATALYPDPSHGPESPRTGIGRLGAEVGLSPLEISVLADALTASREGFASRIPTYRSYSDASQASLLVRFIHDLTTYRDMMLPLLGESPLTLEEFISVAQHLGSHWSREDLEEIALLSEVPGDCRVKPTAIDVPRLVRSVAPGGLAAEFPSAASGCPSQDARAACEAAAMAPSRRSGPNSQGGNITPTGTTSFSLGAFDTPSAPSAANTLKSAGIFQPGSAFSSPKIAKGEGSLSLSATGTVLGASATSLPPVGAASPPPPPPPPPPPAPPAAAGDDGDDGDDGEEGYDDDEFDGDDDFEEESVDDEEDDE